MRVQNVIITKLEDGSGKIRYKCNIGKYQINRETDGKFTPHVSKKKFIKDSIDLYKQKTLSD